MAPNIFSIKDFINETKEDFNSPTTSTFSSKISQCKQMVNSVEENLDIDKNGLSKMKKAVKAIYNGGCADSGNKIYLSEALEKLGINSTNREKEKFIGAAFVKFSFIIKELSSLEKNLMQNLNNIIMFPLENVLKGDLKGVKNDLKKPFDKAWKEYDIKMNKIEKEKKAQAKEAGLIRTEISGAEIAEETDHERKQFQYQMLDYLIKVNEIETKKSFDLLIHFIEYFNVQSKYFRSGLEAIEQFQSYISDLSVQLQQVRQSKEDEKRELVDLKNLLKTSCSLSENSFLNNSITSDQNEPQANRKSYGYSLHQLQGDKQFGCQKQGYLLKKSESKMRVKVWQKRKCHVKDGFLLIWHSDESKPPTKINLLTCQIKTLNVNSDLPASAGFVNSTTSINSKNYGTYFDLISCNRTYHFQVEDEYEAGAWISVLINSKDGALKKEFDISSSAIHKESPSHVKRPSTNDQNFRNLQKDFIEQIIKLPGNDCCVDCGSTKDPTWLSTNFGVLTCIECSGIHREMGVHVSRIQSLTLDNIGTSQLLIARVMRNTGFNDIMEASCNIQAQKPNLNSSMDERNQFIRSKYIHKKYIIRTCTSENELLADLDLAIQSKDIYYLLQVWAEGANLASPLLSNALYETALHYAIMHEFDGNMLPIIDFIVQNSSNLNAVTRPSGNSALHYCVIYNRPESMKLLLRSRADHCIKNSNGKTPLDLAKQDQNQHLIELLECAEQNKRTLFENVNIDLSYQPEDPSTDFSDDDIDDKNWILTPEEMSIVRKGINFSNGQNLNRFRNSNRKFSFKLNTENEPESNEQMSSTTISSTFANQKANNNSRPSSVIGDIQVINIDNNGQNFISLKSANNITTSNDTDQQITFVRGGNVNPTRNSGRGRLRLSAGPDASSFSHDVSDNSKPLLGHATNRAYIGGHSRAASADISGYNTVHGKNIASDKAIDNTLMPGLNTNGQYHHVRNNSVDNYLVNSEYPFSDNNSTTITSSSNKKPTIPAKPSGIVSVFVSGSNSSLSQSATNNKSTGNIYRNINVTSQQPFPVKEPRVMPSQYQNLTVYSGPNMTRDQDNSNVIHPVPPPRKKPQDSPITISNHNRRCVALYDCDADQADELSFRVGEVITILNEVTNDDEWMEGIIESDPSRKGLFPAIFVQFI